MFFFLIHKFSELCRWRTLLIFSRSGDRSNLAKRGSDPKRRLDPIGVASEALFLEEQFFSVYLLLLLVVLLLCEEGELLRAIVAYFWKKSFSGGLFSMFLVGDVSIGLDSHRSELALRMFSLVLLEEGFWADLHVRGIVVMLWDDTWYLRWEFRGEADRLAMGVSFGLGLFR